MKKGFDCDYTACLFDKFTAFVDENGDLDIANNETEMVLTNKYTGVNSKVNIKEFVSLIKTVFPSRKEQMELLTQIF